VDEGPRSDVVKSERTLSRGEEDLVEVGGRMKDVGRGEVGREGDGGRELYGVEKR